MLTEVLSKPDDKVVGEEVNAVQEQEAKAVSAHPGRFNLLCACVSVCCCSSAAVLASAAPPPPPLRTHTGTAMC